MPATETLHILHTNDFHNSLREEGIARLRQAIDALGGAPYLLLDSGDAIGAGNVGVNFFGEPVLDRMSDLGYHAMTMGNREFHFLRAALETKINRARFPILCANVRSRKPGGALPVEPHRLFEVGGLRVAVFGITVAMITERMRVSAVSSFVFDDPVEVGVSLARQLRPECDLLVALTHIGLRQDERLAGAAPEIDLIIGGHSHVNLPTPQEVNGVRIAQAGWHARSYGHVTVGFGGDRPVIGGSLHLLQEKRR